MSGCHRARQHDALHAASLDRWKFSRGPRTSIAAPEVRVYRRAADATRR